MKRLVFLIIILCAIPFLFGCQAVNSRYANKDPFYSSYEDWDINRFPLIKPYEVIQLIGIDEWTVNLHETPDNGMLYSSISEVQDISVANGVIMVFTPYTPEFSENLQDKIFNWFVLIPSKGIEIGFKDESDFLMYIKQYDIHEVIWQNPNSIYREFVDTGCLKWIFECQ
jgi:hypothetical protein